MDCRDKPGNDNKTYVETGVFQSVCKTI